MIPGPIPIVVPRRTSHPAALCGSEMNHGCGAPAGLAHRCHDVIAVSTCLGILGRVRLGGVLARRAGMDIRFVEGDVDIARAQLRALVELAGQFGLAEGGLPDSQDGDGPVVVGELLDLEEEFRCEAEGRFGRRTGDLEVGVDFGAELRWRFTLTVWLFRASKGWTESKNK